MWDMLGRAKWCVVRLPAGCSLRESHAYDFLLLRDAWAKNKDLESYEAKWLYVDAMLKARFRVSCLCMQLSTSLLLRC
jgi:hypothetical protein